MVGEITVPPLPGAVSQVLTRLPVAGTSGMVPLGDIAKVVEVKAPVQVTHVDGARTASVTAHLRRQQHRRRLHARSPRRSTA